MITLYQQTEEIFDIAGNSVGFETQAVLQPDTFFLNPDLVFDWDANTVSVDEKTYYLDKLSTNQDSSIPTVNEWLSTYGNDVKQIFYNGLTEEFGDNPTGDIENIKKRIYTAHNIAKYILEYKYDDKNRCTQISSIAPKGAVAIVDNNGGNGEEEIIEEREQDLFNLKVIPLYDAVINDNVVSLKKDSMNCVFISRNGRTNALYTDAIKINENTGRIQISYTDNNWNLKAVAYTLNGQFIAQFNAVNRNIDINVSDYQTPIEYVALIFSHTSGNLPSTLNLISQEKLGLTITLKEYATINYYNYDAQNSVNSERFYVNDVVTLQPLSISGYEFIGWFTSENSDNDTAVSSIRITNNINVYARFKKIVNVYIHDIDGNGLVDSSVFYSGDELTQEYIDAKITKTLNENESKEYYLDESKTQLIELPITFDMQSVDIDIWVKYVTTED